MSNESKGGGVGICTVVGIVFIILKCCGVLNWSWVWILSPFWIPVALVIFLLIILGIIKALED
jgi:hypothetical protein